MMRRTFLENTCRLLSFKEWVWGSNSLLRKNSSSSFMLLGCSLFHIASWWNYIGCPTRYRTRHFFNNFTTNEDTATKQTHTTDTFLFISHTTNVPLFKFRCTIFIGVRIIKEMPGSVASGTPSTLFTCTSISYGSDQLQQFYLQWT
jgi:hypothetical protein